MKIITRAAMAAVLVLSAGSIAGLSSNTASAQTTKVYRAGDIEIRQPWTRATPKGAPVAGGYVQITNKGKTADRLTGGTFAGAGMVQIHAMSMAGGIMKMSHVDGGLEIKPGQSVTLKPGGLHLMFMRLKGGVAMGKPVAGSLIFAKAGEVKLEFAVAPLGSRSAPDAASGAKHKH